MLFSYLHLPKKKLGVPFMNITISVKSHDSQIMKHKN